MEAQYCQKHNKNNLVFYGKIMKWEVVIFGLVSHSLAQVLSHNIDFLYQNYNLISLVFHLKSLNFDRFQNHYLVCHHFVFKVTFLTHNLIILVYLGYFCNYLLHIFSLAERGFHSSVKKHKISFSFFFLYSDQLIFISKVQLKHVILNKSHFDFSHEHVPECRPTKANSALTVSDSLVIALSPFTVKVPAAIHSSPSPSRLMVYMQ